MKLTGKRKHSFVYIIICLYYCMLPFISDKKQAVFSIKTRAYYHGKNNMIYNIPTFRQGNLIEERNVDFEQRSVKITIFKWKNVSSPLLYHVVPKKEFSGYIPCGALPSYREIATFYHLKNAFVSPRVNIGLEKGAFWKFFTHFNVTCPKGKVISGYAYAVYPPSNMYLIYGHWVNDCLCSFVEMPQWVWQLNPVIICSADRTMMNFHLKALGIDHLQVIDPGENYVYCENLYILKGGDDTHGFGVYGYPLLQEKFRNYYNLSRIKPTKYRFLNRKTYRHFINLKDIINEAEKTYNITFVELYDDNTDRLQQAKDYAEIKLLVSSSGSHLYNAFFMKQGTAMVLLMAQLAAFPEFRMTQNLEIWCIGIINPHMAHYGAPGFTDASVVMKGIGYSLYAIDNGKWPQHDKNYHTALNMQTLKEAYEKYRDKWVDMKDVYTISPD